MEKEKEFTELLFQHQRIIYKVCLLYAKDKDDLADLYQEAVCNLWKNFDTFQNRSNFSTWAYRVSLNTCITDLRKKKRHVSVPLQMMQTEPFENTPSAALLHEMYSLIKRLDKTERMYIMLWLEEKTYDEIAEIIGTSRNQVATKLHRIKNKLKTMSNL